MSTEMKHNPKVHKIILSLTLGISLSGYLSAQPADYNLELVDRIWFPSQEWGSGDTTGGSDVWGYRTPDGEEYAIMGILEGVAFVRISTMEVIDIVSGPQNNDYYFHRDIKTYGHYAYVVNEMTGPNYGMLIINLENLPNSVEFVQSYVHPGNVRSHNLSIDTATGFAYIVRQAYDGFRIVSLENPEEPDDINMVGTPDIHDVYARNDTVYVAEGTNGTFSIWDVSDKYDPVLLTRVSIPNSGYVHNIWPTDDGKYTMTTEETVNKTVKMWDIQDMGNVALLGEYLGESNIAHNTHIRGDFAYISHYTVGVKIVDISDPNNLIEVAEYDTYGLNDIGDFYGCWGAYPFTLNDYVYASDLEGYLTILKFNHPEIPYELSVNYASDWNMVGLPLLSDDASYMTIFPEAIEGTLYSFQDGYIQENELINGTGYWLRLVNSSSVTFTGEEINTLTISLSPGWNLITGFTQEIPIDSIYDPQDLIVPGTVYGFDESYVQISTLAPGKGYWLRSSENGEIFLSGN